MAMNWATLFRAFLPLLMFKETVAKIFQQPAQDSEMAEGSSVDDYHDAASAHSICESSESGKIPFYRMLNLMQLVASWYALKPAAT